MWNSCELLEEYRNKGGTESNTTRFVARIEEYMKEEIYCFSSPGIATIIMLKKKASTLLKLVSNKEEDESLETVKIAKQIKSEVKGVVGIKDNYPVLDETAIEQSILPTLNDILINISPKFKTNQKTVALISSIVTSMVCSKVSMIQVALGLFVREKKIIEFLHEFGVTSSYDEVRRFKISAAHQTSQQKTVILDSKDGLIQGVSDNFDANLSTQNGLKQTHSLATIVLQHRMHPQNEKRDPIPRLMKCELASVALNEPELKIYKGQKKPSMPDSCAQRGVLPLKILCSQTINVKKAKSTDFQFIKEVLTEPSVPDFAGYNTKKIRESGQLTKNQTKVMYRPLINKMPSDPSTILTAMCDIESASKRAGQQVTVFTCDQQLYQVTIDIVWDDPVRWKHFYPRIGGMHWLMSFVGAVGKLMKHSGLDLLMKSAFAGVEKMLLGKKFPMNI